MTLAAAALGFVIVLLDVSVVNVALEALRTGFSTDVAGLQWVINAYTLVFGALPLMAGALGDRFGARAVFVAGLVLFTIASLACGLAPTLATLIAARLAQGVGAALLVPNSLSLIAQAFPGRELRNRAVGWWGAAGGIPLAAGPVVGGLLVTHFGWRSVFLINIPIGLAGLALILRYAPASLRNEQRALDLPGQSAAIVALAALATALTEAAPLGWTHPLVLMGLFVAVLAASGFVLIEARRSRSSVSTKGFKRHDTIASWRGRLPVRRGRAGNRMVKPARNGRRGLSPGSHLPRALQPLLRGGGTSSARSCEASLRQGQPSRWSLTRPIACMKA